MDKQHMNELILLSQENYDHAADRLSNYCAQKYCGVGNDMMEQQAGGLSVCRRRDLYLSPGKCLGTSLPVFPGRGDQYLYSEPA